MTYGDPVSSLAATYLGPITEGFAYPSPQYTFPPPGNDLPIATWQAAAQAADLVATLSDTMSRTVELAYVTRPVYGPIQPDGSAEVSTDGFLAYVVTTSGVARRPHGKRRRTKPPTPPAMVSGTAVELVSAATGVKVTGYFVGGVPTREPPN
jgi:hypothetical protein